MITGEQVKAARKLLGWTRIRLAGRANVAETAVRRVEFGEEAMPAKVNAVVRALEAAGVVFTPGKPPRLKSGVVIRATWDPPTTT